LIQVGSLSLRNPICVAAGTWSDDLCYPNVGAIFTKSLTYHPRLPVSLRDYWHEGNATFNNVGLRNLGVEAFCERQADMLAACGPPVIASVAVFQEDMEPGQGASFVEFVMILDKCDHIAGIELNFSCPNVSSALVSPKVALDLVKMRTDKPIWAKFGLNVTNLTSDIMDAVRGGADAITFGNSVPSFATHPEGGVVSCGMSGPAILPMHRAAVYKVAAAARAATYGTGVPVFACGGIETLDDVHSYLVNGATAVQVGSAHLKEMGISDRLAREYVAEDLRLDEELEREQA
jgi:dihydroorotate dehydrogenase